MHEELFVIRDLNRIDGEVSQARATLAEMVAQVRTTTAAITAGKEALAQTEASLAAVRDAERKLNRRMEEYVLRRDRTKTMIDEGRAPDFLSARRQLEQCTAIVDDLEVEVLEHMEQREEIEAQLEEQKEALQVTRQDDTKGRALSLIHI